MVHDRLRIFLLDLIAEHGFGGEEIRVSARSLTPEEAIGTPDDDDYPLLKGKERVMEADFRGSRGHAYTDLFGNYTGTLAEIADLAPVNNFKRAVFISTLNAVMSHLGLIEKAIHCRDSEPPECAGYLDDFLKDNVQGDKVLLVGLQPRILEALSRHYRVRAVDLDPGNIGNKKSGVVIEPPELTEELMDWPDFFMVTGTTVVNGSIDDFIGLDRPVIFYGVSIAGPAAVLGLTRFCPLGH